MRYQAKKSAKKRLNRWVILAPCLLLLGTGILLGLEKTEVINLYRPQGAPTDTTTSTEPTPIDDIDYTPASPTDNEAINEQKGTGQIVGPNPVIPDTLNVTLTSTGNSKPKQGESLDIRAIITPLTNSGTCTATLTKAGQQTVSEMVNISPQGTYSTCENIIISSDRFSSTGQWNLSLLVTGSDKSKGSASAVVEINK